MFAAIRQHSGYFSAIHAQAQSERTVAADAATDLQPIRREETVPKPRRPWAGAETRADGRKQDRVELSREALELSKLQRRDQEVRAHEAAHAAAGGGYAGAPSFSYQRGPDGQTYAVGGQVSIDVTPVAGDPQATLQKAQQVVAAALAPAEPSGQDLRVAQRAQAMAAKARTELREQQAGWQQPTSEVTSAAGAIDSRAPDSEKNDSPATINRSSERGAAASVARFTIYA